MWALGAVHLKLQTTLVVLWMLPAVKQLLIESVLKNRRPLVCVNPDSVETECSFSILLVTRETLPVLKSCMSYSTQVFTINHVLSIRSRNLRTSLGFSYKSVISMHRLFSIGKLWWCFPKFCVFKLREPLGFIKLLHDLQSSFQGDNL